jgi:hypothetical protein
MTAAEYTPSFATRLDEEWSHLRTARRSLRRVRTWTDPADGHQRDHPLDRLLDGIDDLGEILAATQRGAGRTGEDDLILVRLVELARVDELAGRIVLQRLLPGLTSRSATYRSYHESADLLETVVPAAWMAIRAYDIGRRPHHVAASLISDAVFQAFRRPLRRRSATEVVRPNRSFEETSAQHPADVALVELAAVVRDAKRLGVPTHDLDLIRQLVSVGSPSVVARQRQVTPRTIRNQRDRAVVHIRAAIGVAA